MLISKSEQDGRTFTTVIPLDREGRKMELARIIGGANITETTLKSAGEQLQAAEEFKARLAAGGPFPMFTSCCPAWVKYLENMNPKYLKNISTCKSPMEMQAALIKDKYKAKDAEDGKTTYTTWSKAVTILKEKVCHRNYKAGNYSNANIFYPFFNLIFLHNNP